jgi:hypothetical protein
MRVTMPNMTDDKPPDSEVLDPQDFDRVASRGFVRYELAVTRSELKQDIADIRLEIAETKRELKQDIANVRLEIAEVKRELKQDIAEIRHEIATLRTDLIERFNALDRSMWWKLSVAVVAASALAELFGRL